MFACLCFFLPPLPSSLSLSLSPLFFSPSPHFFFSLCLQSPFPNSLIPDSSILLLFSLTVFSLSFLFLSLFFPCCLILSLSFFFYFPLFILSHTFCLALILLLCPSFSFFSPSFSNSLFLIQLLFIFTSIHPSVSPSSPYLFSSSFILQEFSLFVPLFLCSSFLSFLCPRSCFPSSFSNWHLTPAQRNKYLC